MTINTNSSQVSKFNTLGMARSYSTRTIKASAIVHGDDGLYWVVTLAVMAQLEREGYEVVR